MIWFYAGLGVALWLFCVGIYEMVTSRQLIHLCICLTVVQASTYVLLTAIGYRRDALAPIFQETPPQARMVDPVVQALMLTDIVVEATVVALLLALAVRIKKTTGNMDPDSVDHVRG